MCKSVFVTRPQVPENPHLSLSLADPTEIVLKLHHLSRRNTAQTTDRGDHLWGLWQLTADLCKMESIEWLDWRSLGFLCFWLSDGFDRSLLEPLWRWLPCPCVLLLALAIKCSDKSIVCACVGRWCFSLGEGLGVDSFECLWWWNKSDTLWTSEWDWRCSSCLCCLWSNSAVLFPATILKIP